MLEVEVIETSALGDRSYVVHDGRVAVVVDPQRDIDRIEQLVHDLGVSTVAVAETHIHNDYVTGGFHLAQKTGADYLVCADDEVSFARRGVNDGDVLTYGSLTVLVIATPGHTHTHLSYAVTGAEPGDAVAVFTGGSLLYGSVGRTDLVGSDSTDQLTRAQFHSARKLVDLLPAEAGVYPTHGFGSFCSSGSAAGGDGSTLGEELTRNDALTEPDEDAFVERLVANLTAYPAYYAHMAPRNLAGPGPADLSPPEPVDPEQLRRRIQAGEWVVDLRDRRVYAAGHLAETISIEIGDQFATYLGWLIPWGSPLTLIAENPTQVAEAQRQLVRIGIERPDGAAIGSVEELARPSGDAEEVALEVYPRVTFAELQQRFTDADAATAVVLDVRRTDERADGFIPGSTHIPMHALVSRLEEAPQGEIWVHCAAGFRASIAASLLARAGRQVVLVDDDFSNAVALGLVRR